MGFDFRLPNITGANEKEQLTQIKSYLHQFVEQLQWAMNTVEKQTASTVTSTVIREITSKPSKPTPIDANATFDAIKSLIIKSAEIVEAYYDEINEKLQGEYVAVSDFGTFKEETEQFISKTSTDISQSFTNIQIIESNINTSIGDLETSISYVENDLSETKGNIDASLQGIESNINDLDADLGTTKGNVAQLGVELDTAKGNITQLDTDLGTANSSIGQLGTNLHETKEGLNGNIEEVSKAVGNLDDSLQGLKNDTEKNIKDVSDSVGSLDTKIDDTKKELAEGIEGVKGEVGGIRSKILEVTANIISGLLYYNGAIPVYGIEVGQTVTEDGTEVFKKYARFTADRLSFYDRHDVEVAYISDNKLYITHAEITGTLKLGGYLIDTTSGITFKWVGRE